jgi:hypothetical protein
MWRADLGLRKRSAALWLGLVAASLFLLLQQGAITNSDGASVYAVTRSLVEDGDLSIEPDLGVAGGNGEYYSKYGIGLSVLGVVPYALVRPFAELYERPDALEQAAVASLLPLLSAFLVVALFGLCRRLGAGVRSSVLVALGAVVGTFLITYTKEFFGEPLVALFLVIALERALAERPGQSGLALAAAALVRPEAFAFALVLFPYLALTRGRSTLVRAGIPVAAALVFTLAYNDFRFGGASASGYGDEARVDSTSNGAIGLLFSPEKSLFLFAPVVVLAPFGFVRLWQTSRAAAALLLGTTVVGFVVVASVSGWGSWSWGPRHLITIVPVLLAPCALWLESSARRAVAFVALCTLGLAVSAPAVLVPPQAQQLDAKLPPSPTIWRQYELVPETVRYSLRHSGDKSQDDHRRYLYLWQFGAARELGRAGIVAAIPVSALLAAIVVWSAVALRRSIQESAPAPAAAVTQSPPE